MKRPDKPANPLQELAEKLRNLCPGCRDGLVLSNGVHMFADGNRHEQHIDTSEIAASLGTLLQAERAATIKECADIADCGGMFETAMTKAIRDLPADASALSAVVQRETAKAQQEMRDMGFVHPHDQSRMILSGAAHQRISVLEEVFKAYYGEPSHQFEAWLKEAMQAAITAQMALK